MNTVFTTPRLDFTAHHAELTLLANSLDGGVFAFKPTGAPQVLEKHRKSALSLSTLAFLTRPRKHRRIPLVEETSSFDFKFDPTLTPHQRAAYHLLRARISSDCNAQECDLKAAIKLHPKNADAWTMLGCLAHPKSPELAQSCFEWGVSCDDRNISAKLALAMVLRMKPTLQNLQCSADLCEKVIQTLSLHPRDSIIHDDFKFGVDHLPYLGLAMSHLKMFFTTHSSDSLHTSLFNFKKAENANGGQYDPDLFYSRAIVWTYMEEYQFAIDDLEKARQLDPSLAVSCQARVNGLKNWCKGVCSAVHNCKALPGSATLANTESPNFGFKTLTHLSLPNLQTGKNEGVIYLQIQTVFPRPHDSLAITFICKFIAPTKSLSSLRPLEEQESVAVTFYNVTKTFAKPGDILSIKDPILATPFYDSGKCTVVWCDSIAFVAVNGRIDATFVQWTRIVDTV